MVASGFEAFLKVVNVIVLMISSAAFKVETRIKTIDDCNVANNKRCNLMIAGLRHVGTLTLVREVAEFVGCRDEP